MTATLTIATVLSQSGNVSTIPQVITGATSRRAKMAAFHTQANLSRGEHVTNFATIITKEVPDNFNCQSPDDIKQYFGEYLN